MGHHHHHTHHRKEISRKRLGFTVVLNLLITAVQVVGGILSNSLSLLSDAVHNFSDGIALWVAYIANKISGKSANKKMTFGYKRIEILSAFINSFTMVFICGYLIYEAYHRFMDPQPIDGGLMLIVATVGLLANLISVLLLHKDKSSNINIKAAYLHLMGDTMSSVAVVGGGLLILFYNVYWIDPILTVLICLYIFKETYGVLIDSFNILMQSKPEDVDIEKLKNMVNEFKEVENVHHIHLWKLSDEEKYFECHVDFNVDLKLSEVDEIRYKIAEAIEDEFHIHHITIQTEFNCCDEKSLIPEH